MSDIAVISEKDLSLAGDNKLNTKQLSLLLSKTPEKFIKSRPAKGGGQWQYVSGTYVRKVLNLMFGFDWDFEILDQLIQHGEVVVKGKLTVRVDGKPISKTQFGNKEIATKRGSNDPLSIGNDMKAAATDALKKCAQDLGVAQDVYSPEEFTPRKIISDDDNLKRINDRWLEIKDTDKVSDQDKINVERIIKSKETESYNKVWNLIK